MSSSHLSCSLQRFSTPLYPMSAILLLLLLSPLLSSSSCSPLNSTLPLHPLSRSWTGWQALHLSEIPSSQAAIVYSQGPTSDIFYRNLDYHLIHSKLSTDGTISSTVNRHGLILSEPRAVSPSPGVYTVVATDAQHHVHLGRLSTSNVWTWTPLGGRTDAPPSFASAGPSNLEVFRKGDDNVLYRLSVDDGDISQWRSMGVYTTTSPAAFSVSPGTFDIVIRDYRNSLMHKRFSTGDNIDVCGDDWEEIPNSENTIGDPKMTKTRDNQLLLYAMQEGFISRYAYNGFSWRYLNHGQGKWLQTTPSLVDTPARFQIVDVFQTALHFQQFNY